MKKLKIGACLLFAIVLSNCEVKVNESKAQNNGVFIRYGTPVYNHQGQVRVSKQSYEGIEFVIFTFDGMSDGGKGLYIVNLTKEKLEIELLNKQLKP